MPEQKLKGKVAVITGASKGLGKAMALALAEAGANLALVSRSRDLLDGVAAEARSHGVDAEVYPGDVTSEADVKRIEKEVTARFGKVQILINNAGINNRKTLEEFELSEWEEMLSTNITSVFLMSRSFVPHMRGQGYGRILNLTSIMSHVAIAGRTAYATTKTALLGFTRALALELTGEGITVNGISPGPFATEMNLPLIQDEEKNREFLMKIPLNRWGKPEEIGQLAVYLCSEESGFITGTDIVIDGGWLAQ